MTRESRLLERRPPAGVWGGLWSFPECPPEVPVEEWCQQRLAKFQCPTKIVVMDELPLGPSAKIDKPALRELSARKLQHP